LVTTSRLYSYASKHAGLDTWFKLFYFGEIVDDRQRALTFVHKAKALYQLYNLQQKLLSKKLLMYSLGIYLNNRGER